MKPVLASASMSSDPSTSVKAYRVTITIYCNMYLHMFNFNIHFSPFYLNQSETNLALKELHYWLDNCVQILEVKFV